MNDQPTTNVTGVPQPTDLMSAKAMFRLGLLLVVAAVAFFLRYSFDQGWIGPTARVGLAASAGLVMIVIGMQISGRRPAYGNLLQGGGGGVLYLTAFAAHQRYGLADATSAFVMLIGISGAVVGMALRQRSQPLAIMGVAGALIAPVVVGGRLGGFPGDAGYLVAVVGVASALYLARRWAWLFGVALVGVGTVLSTDIVRLLLGSEVVSATEIQIGITALWVLGWGVAIAGAILHPRSVDTATIVPVAATATLPLFAAFATLAVWDVNVGDPAWMAVTLSLAALHTIAFFVLRNTVVPSLTAATQLVPAALLAVMAWVGGLEGAAILAAISAQAGIMVVVGIRARVATCAYTGHFLAGVVSAAWVIVTFNGIDAVFDATDLWTGLVVLIAAAVAVIIAGEDEPHGTLSQVYTALSLFAGLGWAAMSLGPLPSGPGLVTGVWAAMGIALITWGHVGESSLVRNLGIALMLLSVTKLLLLDMAATSPLVRIGLFAGIGMALLVVGYWLGAGDGTDDSEATPEPEPVRVAE